MKAAKDVKFKSMGENLQQILAARLQPAEMKWLEENLEKVLRSKAAKDLYLLYTLLGQNIGPEPVEFSQTEKTDFSSLDIEGTTVLDLARLFLLVSVLEADAAHFGPMVARLIQIADKAELITFLKYLSLLPNAEDFKDAGVEALRTNISPVFDAIALDNPYPAAYFNEQQWNQMYLKAAFMQRDLGRIQEVDKRANEELTRIISDYAHERWAASREIDPMIWRPVAGFLNQSLREDMKRLLNSEFEAENKAAALCCFYSGEKRDLELLDAYPDLKSGIASGEINWNTIKD